MKPAALILVLITVIAAEIVLLNDNPKHQPEQPIVAEREPVTVWYGNTYSTPRPTPYPMLTPDPAIIKPRKIQSNVLNR